MEDLKINGIFKDGEKNQLRIAINDKKNQLSAAKKYLKARISHYPIQLNKLTFEQ